MASKGSQRREVKGERKLRIENVECRIMNCISYPLSGQFLKKRCWQSGFISVSQRPDGLSMDPLDFGDPLYMVQVADDLIQMF